MLVCLPALDGANQVAEIVFQRISERFSEADLTVISFHGSETPVQDFKLRVIQVTPDDLNPFGLPKKTLKRTILDVEPDVSVDLSETFNPLSAYICMISGARIKIGFAMQNSDLVFNYQVAPRPERTGLDRYRVLAQYIG